MIKPIGQSFFESSSGIRLCDQNRNAKNLQVMKDLLAYEPFAEMVRAECGIDPKRIQSMDVAVQKGGKLTIHLYDPDQLYKILCSISVSSHADPLIYDAAAFLVQKNKHAPQFPTAQNNRPRRKNEPEQPHRESSSRSSNRQHEFNAQKAPAQDRSSQKRTAQLHTKITDLEQQLKDRTRGLEPLQREIARLRPFENGYQELRNQIQRIQSQNDRDREELMEAQNERDDLRPLVDKYNELFGALQETEDEYAELEDELENVLHRSEDLEERVETLTNQLNESRAAAGSSQQLQQDLTKARAQLAEARDREGHIQDELDQAREERNQAQDALRPLREQLAAEKAQRQEAQSQLAPERQAKQDLQQQLTEAQQAQRAAETALNEARGQNREMQEEHARQDAERLARMNELQQHLRAALEKMNPPPRGSASIAGHIQHHSPWRVPSPASSDSGHSAVSDDDTDSEDFSTPYRNRIEELQRQALAADEELRFLRPLRDQIGPLTEGIKDALRQIEAGDRRLEQIQSSYNALLEQTQSLQEQLAQRQSVPGSVDGQEAARLRHELTQSERNASWLNSQFQRAEAELIHAQLQNRTDQQTIRQLQEQLSAAQAQTSAGNEQLIRELAKARERQQGTEAQLQAAQRDLESLRSQFAEQGEVLARVNNLQLLQAQNSLRKQHQDTRQNTSQLVSRLFLGRAPNHGALKRKN